MACTLTHLFFFGVRPKRLTNPSIIRLLLLGVIGVTGTGGISSSTFILSVSTSILHLLSVSSLFLDFCSVSSLFLARLLVLLVLFALFALLAAATERMVVLDRVLSPDFRGRQKPDSALSSILNSDPEDDQRLSSFAPRFGVPMANDFKLRMALSNARSTPASRPPDLMIRGEADMGAV